MSDAPEALIQQAQASLAVGDTNTAHSSLNELLEQFPDHPQGLLRRGFVRVRMGDVEGAVQDWEQALELDVNLQKQLDSGDFRPVVESALEHFKQHIAKEPSNLHYQVLLGRAYTAFGRFAQALQSFTLVLRVQPEEIEAGLGSAAVYLRLGQGEQALAVLQKLYELHPNNANLCWRIGKLYATQNSIVQATRFFERASTLDSEDWRSHLELGQIFLRQGRHEQATTRFQRAQQIKSDCAAALVGLAECCKELYRFEAAISYYQQAVQVDPRDYKALCQMGSLCIQLGGLDMGIDTLLRALDLNDQDVEIQSSLAKAYQQKGDFATAARYFARTVEANPKDYFAAYNLGVIYRSQGQVEEAAKAFGAAASLRPNDSQYQYQSARALLELGRIPEALEASRKAVGLNPHHKESQLLFGRCCLEAKEYEKASEAFRAAVQIDGQNVEAHYQLAVALLHLDQAEEARNSFHTVLRLSPQHAPSQLGLGHVARRNGQWQTAADHYRQAVQLDLGLRAALVELVRLYDERNQKDAINEFLRQICLSRKGDHRIPGDFLKDWLEALAEQELYALGDESLDFIINLYPNSPQAKENHRLFHWQAANRWSQKGRREEALSHLEMLSRLHPNDADAFQLRQTLTAPEPPSLFETEPVAPTPVETLLGGNQVPTKPGLAPPPPLDDWDMAPESPQRLSPPPLLDDLSDDGQTAATEVVQGWESKQVSRLALEDIPGGTNPLQTAQDLAYHYLEFARQLGSGGWLKQANLFLTDARSLMPSDQTLAAEQARLLGRWADRMSELGEVDAASQLRSWQSPLLPALESLAEAPTPSPPTHSEEPARFVPVALETEDEPVQPEWEPPALPPEPEAPLVEASLEENHWPIAEANLSDWEPMSSTALAAPLVAPSVEASPPVALAASLASYPSEPSEILAPPEGVSEFAPVEPESEPLAPAPVPVTLGAEVQRALEEVAPAAAPEPDSEPADSGQEIVSWMMTFQESPPPAPQTEPEPSKDATPTPFKSAEFDLHLTGQETQEELVGFIRRYPDDERVRSAVFRSFSDDSAALLRVFRELCQDDADEPYHVLNLARAYAHTGSDSLAVLQYRKYVKLEKTSEGYRELGQVYERMGKAELAGQALRQAEILAAQEAEDED
jgi:tetratricopeptide (TPR) repeat protein